MICNGASRQSTAPSMPDGEIKCLECGRSFTFLGTHLRVAHQMTARDYRRRWDIPARQALASEEYREKHRVKLSALADTGKLHRDPAQASVAARGAPRTTKTRSDSQEQSSRIAATRPGDHSLLLPSARRADGRDADRAREYQRNYRARLRSDIS